MRILLTNDDGIYARGINTLYEYLKKLGKVYVVAPERERSAAGHGITVHKPLRANAVVLNNDKDLCAWAVSGTPADCVKLALEALLPGPPDLVVSGINWGANVGTDVLYSGTVSAAVEGTIAGLKSMAVSLDVRCSEPNFAAAGEYILELVETYLEMDIPPETLLNVNIPDVPQGEIRGVTATRIAKRRFIDAVEKRKDPRGKSYFWLSGRIDEQELPGTDSYALGENLISISPVQLDLTNYQVIDQIQDHWNIKT
ncbi:MAG: 5'/3'-nucleotidase SurE [Clostridia bacterium]|nr:5'/3'-nucleotidase SurE [Clostridia bacterium]